MQVYYRIRRENDTLNQFLPLGSRKGETLPLYLANEVDSKLCVHIYIIHGVQFGQTRTMTVPLDLNGVGSKLEMQCVFSQSFRLVISGRLTEDMIFVDFM